MEKGPSADKDFSEERRKEIEHRAKADALSFLESRMTKNLLSKEKGKIPEGRIVDSETMIAWEPVMEKAYRDLNITSDKELELYRGTFLIECGYLK